MILCIKAANEESANNFNGWVDVVQPDAESERSTVIFKRGAFALYNLSKPPADSVSQASNRFDSKDEGVYRSVCRPSLSFHDWLKRLNSSSQSSLGLLQTPAMIAEREREHNLSWEHQQQSTFVSSCSDLGWEV